MPFLPSPFPYIQSQPHLDTQAFPPRTLINHNLITIIPHPSPHNNDRHPTRIHPPRANPIDLPLAPYKQRQPHLAHDLPPAVNLDNLPAPRCLVLLVALVFRLHRSFDFPHAPSAPSALPAAHEFGQVYPKPPLQGFVPAAGGHEPVAALEGSGRSGRGDGLEVDFQREFRGDVREGECEVGSESAVRGLGAGWMYLKRLWWVVWRWWRRGRKIFCAWW